MPLIQCKECGKEISSDARVCPHCGKKLRRGPVVNIFLFLLCAIGILLIIGFIGEMLETAKQANGNAPETTRAPEAAPKESWNYGQTTDQMTGKVTQWACLDSEDQLQFGFPYEGGTTGTICLRKGRQLDAYFKIDKGQIVCGVEGCEASLKVDGAEPITLSGSESSDGDPKFVFFDSYSHVLAIAKKAKQIKVEALYYQEGRQTLTFEPSQPLDPKW
jgi:hypothetical protein